MPPSAAKTTSTAPKGTAPKGDDRAAHFAELRRQNKGADFVKAAKARSERVKASSPKTRWNPPLDEHFIGVVDNIDRQRGQNKKKKEELPNWVYIITFRVADSTKDYDGNTFRVRETVWDEDPDKGFDTDYGAAAVRAVLDCAFEEECVDESAWVDQFIELITAKEPVQLELSCWQEKQKEGSKYPGNLHVNVHEKVQGGDAVPSAAPKTAGRGGAKSASPSLTLNFTEDQFTKANASGDVLPSCLERQKKILEVAQSLGDEVIAGVDAASEWLESCKLIADAAGAVGTFKSADAFIEAVENTVGAVEAS